MTFFCKEENSNEIQDSAKTILLIMGIEIEQYNMYSHPIISGHLDKNM